MSRSITLSSRHVRNNHCISVYRGRWKGAVPRHVRSEERDETSKIKCRSRGLFKKIIPSYRLLSITIDCYRFLQERSIIIDKLSFLWLRFLSDFRYQWTGLPWHSPLKLVRDPAPHRGKEKKKSAISLFFSLKLIFSPFFPKCGAWPLAWFTISISIYYLLLAK